MAVEEVATAILCCIVTPHRSYTAGHHFQSLKLSLSIKSNYHSSAHSHSTLSSSPLAESSFWDSLKNIIQFIHVNFIFTYTSLK